jgi:hypothetical protein
LRYLGGMLGGTWLTSLAGDVGNGIFDGAYLVNNFENMNPSNTLWKKNYNLYSKVDTEAPRFLEFEKWWGSPVLLNAGEMQHIADELFVGNRLTSGELQTSDGVQIDLRNIQSPIIVFCSQGDDITPPQQALDWILDLYNHDDEIVAGGQTIIYALHQSIGHLGIFVSAKVATKEHEEFTQAMDLIDALPPGLYEAVMTKKEPGTEHAELIAGDYLIRFEGRSLSDIRALGGNDAGDDMCFAAVSRVSAVNQGLYRMFASPLVQMMANEQTARLVRQMHPHRARFEAFSDLNPALRALAPLAERVRAERRQVSADNPFLRAQEAVSQQIIAALDAYRDLRDQMTETLFMSVYGSPVVQAAVGLHGDSAKARRLVGRDVMREAVAARSDAEIEAHIDRGGIAEATVRALLYIGRGRGRRGTDERSFAVLRQFRASQPEERRMTLPEFKELVREQNLLLGRDEERAIAALPRLLPEDDAERKTMLDLIRRVVAVGGEPSAEVRQRLSRIEALVEGGAPADVGWKIEKKRGAAAAKRKGAGTPPAPEARSARERRGAKASG